MAVFDFIADLIHDLLGGTQSTGLADLGADPDQWLPGRSGAADAAARTPPAFPDIGGSSVMAEVNEAMTTATENYHEGMAIAEQAPHLPSAGQQAQGFINGVMSASPEQLAHMSGQLGALSAGDEARASVGESMQGVLDRNAAHEAIKAADQGLIHGQSVAAAAERAIDQARNAL